ncbi:MAG: hypothetical protein RJA10_1409, partial [Pseudomonadota bacterium]
MRLPSLSIRGMVLAAIVIGVVLPAVTLLLVEQHFARSSQEPVVQRNRANILAQSAAALTEPVWSLDGPGIERATARILGEPFVCGVEVLDLQPVSGAPADTPTTMNRNQCQAVASVVRLEGSVLHEGQLLARVRLSFDGSEIDHQLSARRNVMAALVAVQVLFGVAVLAGVLSQRLLRPIDRLKKQAGQLAAREPMPHHAWPRGDELGELGQHLNTVHGQ